jgi:hemerythrin-like metal-binding protein
MDGLKWSERLSVGNAEFDADHQALIAIIDKLFVSHRQGGLREALPAILAELIDYADDHFEREEEVLRASGYPRLRDQEIAHQRFVAAVLDIRKTWDADKSEDVALRLAALLKEWLIEHIVGMDKQYTGYLAGRGRP